MAHISVMALHPTSFEESMTSGVQVKIIASKREEHFMVKVDHARGHEFHYMWHFGQEIFSEKLD